MNALARVAAIVPVLSVAIEARAAEIDRRQVAAHTELHTLPSLTISDHQFLTGDVNGTAVTVAGQLRIAQGTGRLPVVVLQHGSSGYAANIDAWSRILNAMGISTFALDGFTGRGLDEVNSKQAALGRLNLILDDYRALEILARHPRVDPKRIVLMGFSRGGQATLYASLRRFNKLWNRSGIEYAAYVPFYPDCMTTFTGDTDVADRPIRVFGGALDDYNPVAKCQAYVERLKRAGHDVELTVYPTASHAFDSPLGAQPPPVFPTYQTVRRCTLREENGEIINADTRRPFSYTDACVERGPHLGPDPAAFEAARSAVEAFLTSLFRLEPQSTASSKH